MGKMLLQKYLAVFYIQIVSFLVFSYFAYCQISDYHYVVVTVRMINIQISTTVRMIIYDYNSDTNNFALVLGNYLEDNYPKTVIEDAHLDTVGKRQ
ncbi:hypothetical protein FF38_09822 [Lucilia cuprina]|uniref:Uncharacterized protein n=1 Tax=Lucilia cuprina TaxID=7375 RepID=A0A0L0BTI7_LUCCU|nr:hypothetical protein FF38_09822 [Lucilia cuprina]